MSGACKKLGQLQIGDKKVTLFGVVRMFRPPSLVRHGRCYSCTIELEDESLWHGGPSGHGLTCVMFGKRVEGLPGRCLPGDVALLRGVNVVVFKDRLQGNLLDYGSCEVFDGHVAAPIEPRGGTASCGGVALKSAEVQRVRELKQWAALNQVSSDDLSQTAGPSTPIWPLGHSPSDNPPRKIASLRDGDKHVTVVGVVRYFKPPTKCRGNNSYYVTICVIDDSFETLTFLLFNPDECKLPRLCTAGDLVLVRGLYIGEFDGLPQGKGFEHTSSMVCFSNKQDALLQPREDICCTMTPREEECIKNLREWASEQVGLWPQGYSCPLRDVKEGNFFDLVCQVMAVARNRRDPSCGYVLRVWDGTLLDLPCKRADLTDWSVELDLTLRYTSRGLTQDVFVVGGDELSVKPGDCIYLFNVHAISLSSLSQRSESGGATIKLLVERDGAHPGAVALLKEDDKEVVELHNQIPPPPNATPVWRKLKEVVPSSLTIQLHPEDKQPASVRDILRADSAPAAFSATVKLLSVVSPGRVEDIVQLRCSTCRAKAKLVGRSLKSGDACPRCTCSDASSPARLQLMYVGVLRVGDETGEMDVHVSDRDAAVLFSHVPPANLMVDSDTRKRVLELLYRLTGGNDPFFDIPEDCSLPRPWLKCCVMLYVSLAGRLCYRLFDTVLTA